MLYKKEKEKNEVVLNSQFSMAFVDAVDQLIWTNLPDEDHEIL